MKYYQIKKKCSSRFAYTKKESQGKYVTVLNGKVFDVAVDLRKILNFTSMFQLYYLEIQMCFYIPPGFAHGFCALENNILYITSTKYRNAESEVGINWNDPDLEQMAIKNPLYHLKINTT